MRLAVIDIGSNTVKTTVFDTDGEKITQLSHKTLHAKLSSHIEDGALSEKGISVLIASVNKLKRFARNFSCKKENVFAFATACIRGASNRGTILWRLVKATKLDVRLLSGEEEAELCFLGALTCEGCPQSGVLADLGGGSCEFIAFENSTSKCKVSLNVGALAMYKKFATKKYIDSHELEKLSLYLKDEFSAKLQGIVLTKGSQFIVTGGSARAAAKLITVLSGENELVLPKKITTRETKDLSARITSGELISAAEKVVKERAQTISSALCILTDAAEYLGADSFTVVDGGARNGFASKTLKDKKKVK